MKVLICVVLLAAIAIANPIENVPKDLHKRSAESSENTLSEVPVAQEPSHAIEDSEIQTEDANRDKRHIFFHSWPLVYAAAPVAYASPVVVPAVSVAKVKVTKTILI